MEEIDDELFCKFCRKRKTLCACFDCGFKGIIIDYQKLHEQPILDILVPKIEELRIEIENLKNELREIRLDGKQMKIKEPKEDLW